MISHCNLFPDIAKSESSAASTKWERSIQTKATGRSRKLHWSCLYNTCKPYCLICYIVFNLCAKLGNLVCLCSCQIVDFGRKIPPSWYHSAKTRICGGIGVNRDCFNSPKTDCLNQRLYLTVKKYVQKQWTTAQLLVMCLGFVPRDWDPNGVEVKMIFSLCCCALRCFLRSLFVRVHPS